MSGVIIGICFETRRTFFKEVILHTIIVSSIKFV